MPSLLNHCICKSLEIVMQALCVVNCCSCCRQNSLTAHLITPAKGAHFTMYLVQMKEGGKAAQLAPTFERQVTGQRVDSGPNIWRTTSAAAEGREAGPRGAHWSTQPSPSQSLLLAAFVVATKGGAPPHQLATHNAVSCVLLILVSTTITLAVNRKCWLCVACALQVCVCG